MTNYEIKQIRHLADIIWAEVNKKKWPFEIPLKRIFGSSLPVHINDKNELNVILSRVEEYVESICSNLSPSLLPLFIQMYQLFYNGSWGREPAWLGTVIKRLISNVYKNQFQSAQQFSNSRLDIIQSIYALTLYESLLHYELVGQFTDIKLIINREWLIPNHAETEYYYRELAYMYSDRGRSHRTLKQSIDMWVKNPTKLLDAINNILAGELPSDQYLFRDNFFKLLPAKRSFWEQLRSYVQIGVAVVYQLASNQVPFDYIVFLQGSRELNQRFGFNITSNVYWKKKWYFDIKGKVSKFDIPSLIVFRPAINVIIDKNETINVTSLSIVADAINYFIESSIFDIYSGHDTPFKAFYQVVISTPFEKEVQQLFREYGYITGYIPEPRIESSPECIWELKENGSELSVKLVHNEGSAFPGEIDILAYHPVKKEFIVAECKTFHIPYSYEAMGSFVKRFQSRSKGSYQWKIKNKVSWLRKAIIMDEDLTIPIESLLDPNITLKSMFIVNRKIVNMNQFLQTPVYDIQRLKKILNGTL